jgi:hypothetical protein
MVDTNSTAETTVEQAFVEWVQAGMPAKVAA